MELTDLTTLQAKKFKDMVAYASFKLKPKKVFLAGATPEIVATILEWGRESNDKIDREEHVETIERTAHGEHKQGGTTTLKRRESTFYRSMVGEPLVEQFYLMQPFDEETKAACGTKPVEIVPTPFASIVRKDVMGEGLPPNVEPRWADVEFDLIVIDMEHFENASSELFGSIGHLFGGAIVLYGAKEYPEDFFDLYQRYAGNCLCVLAPADMGTALFLREDAIL